MLVRELRSNLKLIQKSNEFRIARQWNLSRPFQDLKVNTIFCDSLFNGMDKVHSSTCLGVIKFLYVLKYVHAYRYRCRRISSVVKMLYLSLSADDLSSLVLIEWLHICPSLFPAPSLPPPIRNQILGH
jgi:hypothetical protein